MFTPDVLPTTSASDQAKKEGWYFRIGSRNVPLLGSIDLIHGRWNLPNSTGCGCIGKNVPDAIELIVKECRDSGALRVRISRPKRFDDMTMPIPYDTFVEIIEAVREQFEDTGIELVE